MRAAQRAPHKRLPAFGREILELRRKGLVPQGGVIVAIDTWNYGTHRARVVIAPDVDPGALDYSFLAALDVELVWLPKVTSAARRDVTIRAILRCNPKRLLMWAIGADPEVVWIKSVLVGIERAEYA